MPSIYEILHEVANSVIGQFNIAPVLPVQIGDPRTYHHNSGNIHDIINNERIMSARLLQSQLNDVFSTSHTIGNVISTFPETQIINQNHTRTDMVHGIGAYRNVTPTWTGNGVDFFNVLTTVINLFQAIPPNIGGQLIQLPQNVNEVHSIKEMLSLFCVELGRSPSSLITTAMFYEVCLWNPGMLQYAADFYPMAKEGAVSNFREIYNGQAFAFPFATSYLYDNTAGHNILDARRLLCLEETLAIDWYNTLSQNPLPEPSVSFTINYNGTQVNPQQEAEFRAELYALGMRIYGLPLAGSEAVEDTNIGWINSFFSKYTLDALYHILTLRINNLGLNAIKILQGIYLDQDHNNLSDVSTIVATNYGVKTFLVPLNLHNKHATGLIFEKNEHNIIQVKYLDSLNKPISLEIKQLLTNNLSLKINLEEIIVEQQKYSNCGPEIIENFVLYLTGNRITQEEAIVFHSQLLEDELLFDNTQILGNCFD